MYRIKASELIFLY